MTLTERTLLPYFFLGEPHAAPHPPSVPVTHPLPPVHLAGDPTPPLK